MVDSIVSNHTIGETLVSHSQSDWEHTGQLAMPLTLLANSTSMEFGVASDDTSASIGSFVAWFALQPYLLSLWAMDMASVVGRASRGHGDKLLFLSLILLAANGVFDTLLVVSISFPTGVVIWWDLAIKAMTSLLLVLRSLLFARGSDVMATVRATGEAILVAVAPAAAVLGVLVLGFALTFHTLFSNLDPVHSSFLGSLTATVLALGDTASLSSQPFSSSPFALVAVPLLYAFIGITVAMLLTIFGIVVRICSQGIPGAAASALAQERAEIIVDLWADDTDGQLLMLARALKMPYDLVFDAIVMLLWQLTELLPWVRTLTRKLPLQSSSASFCDIKRNGAVAAIAKQQSRSPRPQITRGRLPWVHALFASHGAGGGASLEGAQSGHETDSPGVVRALTQRLDAEMKERAALSDRLEQMSAQMEALIDLGSYNAERSLGRRSASADRQSPSSAAHVQRSFASPGEGHRERRRSSSRGRTSRGSTGSSSLRLRGGDSPPWHSDEDDQQDDDSEDDDDGFRPRHNTSRRRRAQ
jgi:hypothetical protein